MESRSEKQKRNWRDRETHTENRREESCVHTDEVKQRDCGLGFQATYVFYMYIYMYILGLT